MSACVPLFLFVQVTVLQQVLYEYYTKFPFKVNPCTVSPMQLCIFEVRKRNASLSFYDACKLNLLTLSLGLH